MDPNLLWHSLGGGALIACALTLVHLLLDYGMRASERRGDRDERRRAQRRDAEARLERVLQDRLAASDRRLERSDADLRAERVRVAVLEQDLLRVQQAYELLSLEYATLKGATDQSASRREPSLPASPPPSPSSQPSSGV
jgi:hypothetical protein